MVDILHNNRLRHNTSPVSHGFIFLIGLESSLKHQEQEKREMEITKRREEQIKRFTAELEKLKQEHEVKKSTDKDVISDLDGGKRACSNRLSAGKCQLLRWFGKGCTGKKMIVNCRASCGLC